MKSNQKGFIGLIVLIIVALIIVKYVYDWSIFEAASSTQGQETISYTHQVLGTIWSYIATPTTFVYNQIFLPLVSMIWANFQSMLTWGQQNAAAGIH